MEKEEDQGDSEGEDDSVGCVEEAERDGGKADDEGGAVDEEDCFGAAHAEGDEAVGEVVGVALHEGLSVCPSDPEDGKGVEDGDAHGDEGNEDGEAGGDAFLVVGAEDGE